MEQYIISPLLDVLTIQTMMLGPEHLQHIMAQETLYEQMETLPLIRGHIYNILMKDVLSMQKVEVLLRVLSR